MKIDNYEDFEKAIKLYYLKDYTQGKKELLHEIRTTIGASADIRK